MRLIDGREELYKKNVMWIRRDKNSYTVESACIGARRAEIETIVFIDANVIVGGGLVGVKVYPAAAGVWTYVKIKSATGTLTLMQPGTEFGMGTIDGYGSAPGAPGPAPSTAHGWGQAAGQSAAVIEMFLRERARRER